MTYKSSRLKLPWKDVDTFITAAYSQNPVNGLTHNFYKYPARFSPIFARTAIEIFSRPGDLVADPFVGGGTSLVESRAQGRLSIGTDISSLATFVSRTKTQVLSGSDLEYLSQWFERLPDNLNLRRKSSGGRWAELGYARNLECQSTWPIRKAIEIALEEINQIRINKHAEFARCVLLRTAQTALDGRKDFPSIAQFRARITDIAKLMLDGSREYTRAVRQADKLASSERRRRVVCLNSKADGLAEYILKHDRSPPKLIVTSPPYPGVHILYHRWQVRGGKETPVPFWIANQLDGSGESYYLMHARRADLNRYYEGIASAFSSLSRIADKNTVLVQLVAFSDPNSQLDRYLNVMDQSGFEEYLLSDFVDSSDGRLWRTVPNRRWHATNKGELASGREVVLIHKPK